MSELLFGRIIGLHGTLWLLTDNVDADGNRLGLPLCLECHDEVIENASRLFSEYGRWDAVA